MKFSNGWFELSSIILRSIIAHTGLHNEIVIGTPASFISLLLHLNADDKQFMYY